MAIAGVESDYGHNINHRTIASENSIHFGDSAIGLFGLMPNTIKLLKKDPIRVKLDLNYQKQVAWSYAIKVLSAAQGCPLRASILWLRGPGARPKESDYTTSRYNKFISEWAKTGEAIESDPLILRYCD